MPTNIKIIHAREFIRATPEGRLDLERFKALLLEIASVSASLEDYETIVDTRKAEVGMSTTDLWYGFFALAAQNRGFPVRAFTSFEGAIEWLIADET